MHLNNTNYTYKSVSRLTASHGAHLSWVVFFSFYKIVLWTFAATSPAELVLRCLSGLKCSLGWCLSEYNKVDGSR